MAVSLTLAVSKLELDLTKTRMIAERIGLSRMGYELIVPGLERDVALVAECAQLMRDMCDLEPQVRAMIQRKKTGRWPGIVHAIRQSAAAL
jgi:hypothetical protein